MMTLGVGLGRVAIRVLLVYQYVPAIPAPSAPGPQ
jgi:hypothetical protein